MDYDATAARLAAVDNASFDAEIKRLEALADAADQHVALGEQAHRDALAGLDVAGSRPAASDAAAAIIAGRPLATIVPDRLAAQRDAQVAFDGLQELRRRAASAHARITSAREQRRDAVGEAVDGLADQIEADLDEAVQALAVRFAAASAIDAATRSVRLGLLTRRLREPIAQLVEEKFLARGPIAVPDDALEMLELVRDTIEAGGGRIHAEIHPPRPY